jgi:hypothetical protein
MGRLPPFLRRDALHGGNRLEGVRNIVARLIGRLSIPVLFVFIVAMTAAPGCSRSSSDTVPDSLLGVWTTPDPRYAGRFLDLRPHSVTFGLGEDGQSMYPVSSVEWTSEQGQSVFTIYYEAEDGSETAMSFYHAPFDGILVFKNQLQTYWRKIPT